MAKIVLEIVPFGFEGVECLVLDLPPRPSCGGEVLGGVGVDRQVGDEAVAIGDLVVAIADDDFEPIDVERVLAVADGHALHRSPSVGEALFPPLDGFGQRRNFDADQIFVKSSCGCRVCRRTESARRRPEPPRRRAVSNRCRRRDRPDRDGCNGLRSIRASGAALDLSQSCLSYPCCGSTNSGRRGRTQFLPGLTMQAATTV